MALQHHFIVVVENGVAYIDHDVSINFDEGRVYDTETDSWTDAYEHYLEYEKANELLQNALATVEWANLTKENA
jgi:hypothetical protein